MSTLASFSSFLVGAGVVLALGCSSSETGNPGSGTGGNGGGDGGSATGGGGGTSGSATGGGGGASAGGAGGAGTGGRPADLCQNASSCPGGACWQRLDGVKDCVSPKTSTTLDSCDFATPPCCTKDSDCADGGTAGRCFRNLDVIENFCGGAAPQGNVCRYDTCASDADCTQKPAGATAATCLPSGALGTYFAKCAYGGCRTNADCTKHPGGVCSYGLAATHGTCSLVDVLYCAYPDDPCGTPGHDCTGNLVCAPNDDYQGRSCTQGPPMYP